MTQGDGKLFFPDEDFKHQDAEARELVWFRGDDEDSRLDGPRHGQGDK